MVNDTHRQRVGGVGGMILAFQFKIVCWNPVGGESGGVGGGDGVDRDKKRK